MTIFQPPQGGPTLHRKSLVAGGVAGPVSVLPVRVGPAGTKIVPGGERVGKSPAGGPALRANGDRLTSVIRRSDRPRPSFSRRNERPAPAWSDDPRRFHIDWGYLAFVVGFASVAFVLTFVALERAA